MTQEGYHGLYWQNDFYPYRRGWHPKIIEKIGIHPVQWANYERRFNEMPIRYLVKFCQHYGVSADYILGLGRDMNWPR